MRSSSVNILLLLGCCVVELVTTLWVLFVIGVLPLRLLAFLLIFLAQLDLIQIHRMLFLGVICVVSLMI